MLIGTYEGKTIHCYHIGGKEYYVRRGSYWPYLL